MEEMDRVAVCLTTTRERLLATTAVRDVKTFIVLVEMLLALANDKEAGACEGGFSS